MRLLPGLLVAVVGLVAATPVGAGPEASDQGGVP
jgi:hypothetical protein